MKRRILIAIVSCILAMGMMAETVRVMRFVPVAGEESEATLSSLRKVVFSRDSIVLIAAKGGTETAMYKFDYQAIVFAESGSEEGLQVTGDGLRVKSEKFIQNGQLYIRRDNHIYNIFGNKIQ